jgi:hypothetical protein
MGRGPWSVTLLCRGCDHRLPAYGGTNIGSARLLPGLKPNWRGRSFGLRSHKSCFTPRLTLQNQSLCHNIPDRSRPH